ncbi:MAG TPA: acyl-CoA dehydrogenase family protein, partial [Ilumatobacter sp.]
MRPNPQHMLDGAIDELLAAHDPAITPDVEFRGARYDAGLAWVHFPMGFGGLGLRPELNRHVEKRLRDAGARPADPTMFFMALAGPTIVTHATDEQKRRLLRPMFTGEERWCQLFSEPGAGSDFAGLATRAVRDGEEWIVNGQKVWNTIAHIADRGMLVARSNPELPKHKGMTYFALDMHSPGVEVRPLRQITGEAEFNEVYLTDVRVPDADRIGAEGEGWRASLTTLMNERSAIGTGGASGTKPRRGGAANDAVAVWEGLEPSARTPVRRDELMRLWVRGEVGRLTNLRAAEAAETGNPGPEMSIAKLEFAEFNKELYSFCIDLLGADGMVGYDYSFGRPTEIDATGTTRSRQYSFLRVRANSIEGG